MTKKKPGSVRIIGGSWRGTRLPVPDIVGLRPSGDRSRETLFNWLQAHVRGARCVDLFAGSGALGLEAASRGASEVTLVELAPAAAAAIRNAVKKLDAKQVRVLQADAMTWLGSCDPQSMDIVFIDPPFGMGLEVRSLELLVACDLLAPGGFAYVETAREADPVPAGPVWEIFREKTVGEVRMQLLRRNCNNFERN